MVTRILRPHGGLKVYRDSEEPEKVCYQDIGASKMTGIQIRQEVERMRESVAEQLAEIDACLACDLWVQQALPRR